MALRMLLFLMPSASQITPEHVAELERRIAAAEAEADMLQVQNDGLAEANGALSRMNADLSETNNVLTLTNADLAEANARLERLLAQARHQKFGPSSEKGSPDQRNLFTEDIEVAEGMLNAAADGEPMERQWSERHWRAMSGSARS